MVKRKARHLLATALALTCASVSLGSQLHSGNQEAASTKPHAPIRLFNLARVPRPDLGRAEAEVIRIFAGAEIEVSWADGDVEDRSSLTTHYSANNSSPARFKVARK